MALPARLLLVDDDKNDADLLCPGMMRAGHHVDLATDGHGALEMLHSKPYDLVLLACTICGTGGIEVLRRIRTEWSAADLPVIMITALDDSVVSALQLGANDYVIQPLNLRNVMARIETRIKLAITDREMRRANDFYQMALGASEEGLWDWDLPAGRLYYSPGWKSMLGLAEDEVSSSPEEWFGRIHPEDRTRVSEEIQAQVEGRGSTLDTEYRICHKDGRYRWVENRGNVTRNATGRVVRMAGHQTDITPRKTIDPVTSLPNRTWLDQELSGIAAEERQASLVLFDFDLLEESLPNSEAERIMAMLASRLSSSLRGQAGRADVVRSGEHQLAVLLQDVSDSEEAVRLAECLQAALREPFPIGGEQVFVTACAGIAAIGADGCDQLMRRASSALRHARERGPGSVEVFQTSMRQQDLEKTRLVNDLRGAVGRSEFVVYYQPKVRLVDGQIIGSEALVRWNRPGYGLVQPHDFIPTAERTGIIVSLGRYVLERACRDTAELRESFPDMGVSVNVSGRQLAELDLVEQVCECLASSGLDASALRLEITETFLVEDPDKAFLMLSRLRGMGVGLKLDDFGSGYSSLTYLQQYPFDTLKIDRSFVSRLPFSHETAEIVRAIAGLARSLNMEMVAEGIENQAQLDWLRDLGCCYGQGYWFSPPVDFGRLRELLESHHARDASPKLIEEVV